MFEDQLRVAQEKQLRWERLFNEVCRQRDQVLAMLAKLVEDTARAREYSDDHALQLALDEASRRVEKIKKEVADWTKSLE